MPWRLTGHETNPLRSCGQNFRRPVLLHKHYSTGSAGPGKIYSPFRSLRGVDIATRTRRSKHLQQLHNQADAPPRRSVALRRKALSGAIPCAMRNLQAELGPAGPPGAVAFRVICTITRRGPKFISFGNFRH
jgi:hypothetical protein